MKTKYVKSERDILLMLNHPNVVRLFFTFADERRLYFIMELITGGEFLTRLKRRDAKKKEVIQYYMAELLEAIIYIHSKDIVHRDLVSKSFGALDKLFLFTLDLNRNRKICCWRATVI